VPMLKRYGDGYYPSLTLAVLGVSLEAKAIKPITDSNGDLEWLDVGGLRIPVAPDGTALVPYRGPRGTFKYVSATEVMQDRVPADAFAGAIVLVGTSAKGLQDLRPTPVAPDYPGVEIHASLLTGMLNDEMLSVPPGANEAMAIAMVIGGLLALFALPYRRPLISTLGVLALIAVAIGGNLYLWHASRVVYPLAALVVLLVALGALNLLTGFVREANAIRQLSDMFGEYVPRERVEQMRESGERFSMQGESREMSVLFSDVRNFTALSENLAPAELSAMLNTYLTRITEIIHTHHGTIDKYIGDAVMAFWGAPLANTQHATDAVKAALAMNAALPKLRDEFTARGWPALSIGAGLNSGTMNVGDMGSQFRKAYTVLGDAVNLASRLEGLTKVYGVSILIGEDTRRVVPDIVCREIDRVRVKGRETPVAIYQPLGESLTPAERDELDRYHAALKLYRERKFDEAGSAFGSLATEHREISLYTIYSQRSSAYVRQAPPVGWDGATTFETK
jgi:adenylate cyclase